MFGRSSKPYAKRYANSINDTMLSFGLLPNMIPCLKYIGAKPFDKAFEAQLFAFFDERAAERKAGVIYDSNAVPLEEHDFLYYVFAETYFRNQMKKLGASLILRLIREHFLRSKDRESMELFGQSCRPYAKHYGELITLAMDTLGLWD